MSVADERKVAPASARYRIRRLAAGPLARQGAVAGAIIALLPGMAAGALLVVALRAVRGTLDTWRAVRLPVPLPLGVQPVVNFVDVLRLSGLLEAVRSWDATPLLTFGVTAGVIIVLGALGGCAVGLVFAALYRLGATAGGGLEVELEALPERQPAAGTAFGGQPVQGSSEGNILDGEPL